MVNDAGLPPLIPRDVLFGNPDRVSPTLSPDGTRMGKGISLSHDEMAILKGLLDDLEL